VTVSPTEGRGWPGSGGISLDSGFDCVRSHSRHGQFGQRSEQRLLGCCQQTGWLYYIVQPKFGFWLPRCPANRPNNFNNNFNPGTTKQRTINLNPHMPVSEKT